MRPVRLRRVDPETDITTLEGDVDTIETDLATLGFADRCTWRPPISVMPLDPRGCTPGFTIGERCSTTTSCDAGQFAAAGACTGDPSTAVAASEPDGTTGWTCELIRSETVGFGAKWTAGVLCCD